MNHKLWNILSCERYVLKVAFNSHLSGKSKNDLVLYMARKTGDHLFKIGQSGWLVPGL